MGATDKLKGTVTKTYGSSWVFTIILALIMGAIGFIVGYRYPVTSSLLVSGLFGFIVGAVMTIFAEILVLASFIPYAGIFLQFIWTLQLDHILTHLAGFPSSSPMNTLIWIPLIVFMVFGAILYAVITGIVTVILASLADAVFR